MDTPLSERPSEPQPSADTSVPWSARDAWLGMGMMVLITLGLLILLVYLPQEDYVLIPAMLLAEAVYAIPIAIIFGWRRIPWKRLGFYRFDPDTLALGCGILMLAYSVIWVHNLVLQLLGIRTQGDMIEQLLQSLGSPVWFFFAAVVLAPLVEEMFFRGFLFPAFRQRYGWVKALLLSSGLFALAHGDPAAFIPIFLLGCVLAYVYHRSGSIWPGIILHFLVNAFGLCATYSYLKFSAP